ncbi:MAG: methylenetetrahydrofolate reductase [NAD(P)H] [Phycisphaeraceae bacterium]|nr:MAG: methylenetetrahydrofolate reductase [NAD(P)H] [Phycisphaeraceae bacterium]
MDIRDVFQSRRTTFSFEFFPPRTAEGAGDLFGHIKEFEKLKPTFVSVTYGAGGSTRQLTHDLVVKISTTTPLDPMPHLTCVGHDEREIDEILSSYAAAGINKILALRGDRPKGVTGDEPFKHFRHAADLVGFIRKFNESGRHPDRRGFAIGVAGFPEGHPDTPNRLEEMDRLKAKIDRGADFIVTQLFFDNRDLYDFRDRCELAGVRTPIIAGVMPITSIAGMKRMADLAAGARYPAPLIRAINRAGGNDAAVRRVGVHWATEQCRDLLDHKAAGIHLYTLNKSTATREIYATLGVENSLQLI